METTPYEIIWNGSELSDACKNTAGIYYWKNNLNGKGYVGETVELRNRMTVYIHLQHKRQKKFYNAIKSDGISNFTGYKIMDCCPSKVALHYWETYYIKKLNTLSPFGYNLKISGSGGMHVEETKIKISKKHIGKIFSAETRAKMSKSGIGRKCPWVSARLKGTIGPNLGKRMSEETKQKLRVKALLRTHSQSTRDKISAANKGRTVSDETKKRMSDSTKLYWKQKQQIMK